MMTNESKDIRAKPLVVVQNNHVVRLTAPVAIAARGLGIDLHDVSSGEMAASHPLPDGEWSPILVIGSVLFVHQWARDDERLRPWVFWDDDRYDAALWARMLGDLYLNADGRATTVGEFQQSTSTAAHVRPRGGIKMVGDRPKDESNAGQRSIAGFVVTPQELEAHNIEPDTRIWAAPPKRIRAEVRTWMIGGSPVAGSTYRIDDRHDRRADHPYVEEAMRLAGDWHRTWHPGRHYVVDLALTDAGWRIVEYNPIHSSGWYDADPGAVIGAFIDAERQTDREATD